METPVERTALLFGAVVSRQHEMCHRRQPEQSQAQPPRDEFGWESTYILK